MSSDSHIQIRISEEEKLAAQEILSRMGLNLSAGIKLFLRKLVSEQKLPFEIAVQEKKKKFASVKSSQQKPSSSTIDTECNPFTRHKIGSKS